MRIYLDTSALVSINWDDPAQIERLNLHTNFLYVCPTVLEELEHLKVTITDSARLACVRRAIRTVAACKVHVNFVPYSRIQRWLKRHRFADTNDSRIIACAALDKGSTLLTGDISQYLIAKHFVKKIEVILLKDIDYVASNTIEEHNINDYTGYVNLSNIDPHAKISEIAEHRYINEYLNINYTNGTHTILRNSSPNIKEIKYSPINSRYLGKIGPKNQEQEMLFDLLQNPEIKVKVALGCYGSGKSLCMLAHAIDFVQRGKFDKIVFIRNNIQVKDTRDICALPGNEIEKLWPYLMPIADHVGGEEALTELIETSIIEPVHLGFLRGRDFRRSIIFCDECENLTRQHVQLILGRCAEGSQVWFAGDLKQTDHINFERNAGLVALIERLAGNKLFGMVKLAKSERGEVSQLADLLD